MYYYAQFEKDERGGYFVEFKDIQWAYTQGDDFDDAMEMAKDILLVSFELHNEKGIKIPLPRKKQGQEIAVTIDACSYAKVLLHNAMLEQGVNNVELAKLLKITPQAVGRLFNFAHKSKIEKIEQALNVLGYDLNLTVSKKNQ